VVADITKRVKHAGGAWLRILLVLAAVAPREAQAQPAASKEYQLKAAFLFNFAQFVEWPPSAFPNTDTPISICILGENPFGSALDETVRGAIVHNRRLLIQRAPRVENLKDCHLIFISRSETARIAGVLAELEPRAVLTVSEVEGFAQRGGIINMYLAGNKVRFEINLAVARRKGLKISSELLSLGRLIETDPAGEGR
jgi:hypothetical protein